MTGIAFACVERVMFRLLRIFRITLLGLLPAAASEQHQIGLLGSGGASLLGASAALRMRADRLTDLGFRISWYPTVQSYDLHITMFRQPAPETRGKATFVQPEFTYSHEDGSHGEFWLVLGQIYLGREHRFSRYWGASYQGGGGLLWMVDFQGGGPPIWIPFAVNGRAELLFYLL